VSPLEASPGIAPALDIRVAFAHLPAPREEAMARSEITGKRKLLAQNVSHSNIKTKRWQNVNIQTRRIWVPELHRFVTLRLTTRDIRTIDKVGVTEYAKRHGFTL
jgi:large subunit ribosomal protein L28